MQTNKFSVYLTIYNGLLLPPFYIGSKDVASILSGYRGSVSSKEFKEIWCAEIKNNPHLFQTIILSYHATRKEAFNAEALLHEQLNVLHSPHFINQSIANGKFSMLNKKHSVNSIEKMKRAKQQFFEKIDKDQFYVAIGQKISETKRKQMALLSKEEKIEFSKRMRESQLNRSIEEKSKTAQKISSFWQNRSEKEKLEFSEKHSYLSKQQFALMTETERTEFSETVKNGLQKMSTVKKLEMRQKRKETLAKKSKEEILLTKTRWRNSNLNKSDEEKALISKKKSESLLNRSLEEKIATSKKLSESLKGQRGQIVECPHCGKQGSNKVMSRWHFDNCKQKR